MKKVVILSAFLTPLRSGAEACAEEVAIELVDQFDVTIITARMKWSLPRKDLLQEKVNVRRVGLGCVFDKWLFPFLAPIAARSIRPDIIHAILETFAGLALYFCKSSNAKRILTCQTTNRSFLKGMLVRSPDVVTVISKALQKHVEALGRTDAVLIPNGLRLNDMPKSEKIVGRILFVGRLEKMKGVDVLLEAMQNLPPHAHLHVVGDGSLKKDLELKTNLLKFGDKVTFLGFKPTPDVYTEYAQAQIFCGLSRSEALGNVFLEAQAAECAVVATEVGGIPDIVHDGETGLLVPSDNAEAAHIALTHLLEDGTLRDSLAQAGKEHAQQYDWSAIAQRYAELYR